MKVVDGKETLQRIQPLDDTLTGRTYAAIKFVVLSNLGKCPKTGGYKRLSVNGSVKAATGAAKNITKVGQKVTASQCVITSGGNAGKSMLEPGTRFKL